MTQHFLAGRRKWLLVACLVCAWSVVAPAQAGGQEVGQSAADSLRREIAVLRARLDSLMALLEASHRPQAADTAGDPLAALRAAAAAAAGEPPAGQPGEQTPPEQGVGRQRSLQALNPEITVTGDFYGLFEPENPDENHFHPKEVEVSMQSALDPFSRAKVFIGHHLEGGGVEPFEGLEGHGHEGEEPEGEDAGGHGHHGVTELEEGFIEWVNLPGGFGLTVGKFRQRLGTYNRWHPHALPGRQLPLPYLVFLGDEGLAQFGASFYWLAPVEGFGTYQMWFQATRSSNESLFGESTRPSYLAHLNAFWDISPSTYFEIGVSGITGTFEHDEDESFANRLLHLEGALTWRPPQQGLYRELNLRGALLWNRKSLGGLDPEEFGEEEAVGGFALAEYRFRRQWLVGFRYDYVGSPYHREESAWMVAPTLTWWQSEWVRIRAEYDYLSRPEDTFGQLVIQFTFSMGPHKHENY